MNIGDHVVIKNKALLFHERRGVVEDFENPKLRDSSSLVLVRIKPDICEWFFGYELETINIK